MNKLIAIITVMLLTGCTSYNCVFPTEINSVAHGCRNDAQAKIQRHGVSLKTKSDCRVFLVPATININGMWCWKDVRWPDCYVGGLCGSGGANIQIGCNPNNRADIHVPSLTHEMGHHWLMSNLNDYTHNPTYDSDFDNWRGARQITGSSTNSLEHRVVIQVNSDGSITHVDTIRVRK